MTISTTTDSQNSSRAVLILLGAMLASLLGLLLVPAIPQDQTYHNFVDQRALFGIPNFWNVVSNLPFIVVGAVGLATLARGRPDPAGIAIFAAILLTGFGSSYYHWTPGDSTLFWDRLPMALTFMAIFAATIEERLDARVGAAILWPLLVLGVVSLLVWRWTDDLRLYGWVQFFPCPALPLMFLRYPPRYTGTSYWIAAALLYVLAKVLEYTDRSIYALGDLLSGHTLKHLAAAAACFAILRYFQTRRRIA